MLSNEDTRKLAQRMIQSPSIEFVDSGEAMLLAESTIWLLDENERLTDKLADEIMDTEDTKREETADIIWRDRFVPMVDENDEPLT